MALDTQYQVPDKSILDLNGRQTYLGNSFVAGVPSAAVGATTETPYMLIINPAGNNKSMFNFLRRMSIITTSSAIATFRFYVNPTITGNGTAATPLNLRVNSASLASGMSIRTGAITVSSPGTFVADICTTSSGNPTTSELLFVLDPGNTVYVTVTASSGTAPVAFETAWFEI